MSKKLRLEVEYAPNFIDVAQYATDNNDYLGSGGIFGAFGEKRKTAIYLGDGEFLELKITNGKSSS